MSDHEATLFLLEMSTASLFRSGEWSQIGIAEATGMALIGDIGLLLAEDGKHLEIGFTLRRQSQGGGVATIAVREAISLAFECTEVEEVQGTTDARNLSSIRLLERVGMCKRGSTRALFRGEHCIEHTYGISRQTDG